MTTRGRVTKKGTGGAGSVRQARWAGSHLAVVLAVPTARVIWSPPTSMPVALSLSIGLGVDG
jgi:hypothetical protein